MRQLFQELADVGPARCRDIGAVAVLKAGDDQLEKFRGLLLQVVILQVAGGAAGFQPSGPFAKQLRLFALHCIERAGLQCCHLPFAPEQ
ncbi:hypothetical protein D3C87_1801200 [compost metagenome]